MLNLPYLYFLITTSAYLYVVCAIHHHCPLLLIVYIWSRLPQLFGLVPLPVSRLCIWEEEEEEHKEGIRLIETDKINRGKQIPEAQTSKDTSHF